MSAPPDPRAGQFYPKADFPVPDDALRAAMSAGSLAPHVVGSIVGSEDVSDLALLASGTFSDVWMFRRGGAPLVAKIDRSGILGESGFAVEHALSPLIERAGVRAPRVESHGRAAQRAFVVMHQVRGETLRSIDDDETRVDAAHRLLAVALRRVHEISVDGAGLLVTQHGAPAGAASSWAGYLTNALDAHVGILRDHGVVDPRGAHAIELSAPALEKLVVPAPRLLHGDCGPHNLVLDGDGAIWILDWEEALAGDPVFELAQWATFQPQRRWSGFFTAYAGGTWEPSAEFWLYFLRVTIAKAVVRVRLGLPDHPGRPTPAERVAFALSAAAHVIG